MAISHVNAHRIGNPDNSIPSCQLGRLRQFLRDARPAGAAPDSCLDWMDILCVPAGRKYHQSQKDAAAAVAQTY